MSISTNPYQMLIDKLHTKERNILISHAFIHDETKLCLLDFIGASQYFITDFGTVWWRQKFCPEKNGKITNGWVPMVERDVTYPSPWVFLSTTIGNLWWPVNQLLGWAFHPVTDNKKYSILFLKIRITGHAKILSIPGLNICQNLQKMDYWQSL